MNVRYTTTIVWHMVRYTTSHIIVVILNAPILGMPRIAIGDVLELATIEMKLKICKIMETKLYDGMKELTKTFPT